MCAVLFLITITVSRVTSEQTHLADFDMAFPDEVFQFSERTANVGRRRQASKPMLERQRRARINNSLDELKNLVLSALYRDADQYSQKMEKAEILELAVNFLKMSRKRQNSGSWSSESTAESLSKYRAGYNDCTARIFHHLENDPGISDKLREKVLSRLATFCYAAPTVDCTSAAFCRSCVKKSSLADGFLALVPPCTAVPATASQYYNHITPPSSPISCECRHFPDKTREKPEVNAERHPLWRPWLAEPKAEDE